MGDRIVVMRDGFIQQVGAPLEIYNNPNNVFVAGFIGSPAMNFLDVILRKDGDDYIVDGGEFKLTIARERAAALKNIDKYINKEVVMGIRPEDIEDAALTSEVIEPYTITASVDVTEPMGAEVYAYFSIGRHSFVARLEPTTKAQDGSPLKVMLNNSRNEQFRLFPCPAKKAGGAVRNGIRSEAQMTWCRFLSFAVDFAIRPISPAAAFPSWQ